MRGFVLFVKVAVNESPVVEREALARCIKLPYSLKSNRQSELTSFSLIAELRV